MESTVVIVVTIAVAVLVVGRSMTRQSRPRKRREAELRVVADRMGFTYAPHGDPFKEEPFLEQGMMTASRQLAKAFYGYPHFLRGQGANDPVTIFDVWHGGGSSEGRSDAQHPFQVTMAAFTLEDLDLPPMRIAPERRSDRIGDATLRRVVGAIDASWSDIDFDEHESFSHRYSLRSADEARTRALFDPTLVAFWESLPENDRLSAAASGHSLVVHRQPKSQAERKAALPPADYDEFVRQAESIVAAFRAATPPAR